MHGYFKDYFPDRLYKVQNCADLHATKQTTLCSNINENFICFRKINYRFAGVIQLLNFAKVTCGLRVDAVFIVALLECAKLAQTTQQRF